MDFLNTTALYDMPDVYDMVSGYTQFTYYGALLLLILVSTACARRSVKQPSLDEIATRNSKLALMLMMVLLESPEKNQKYIRLAKNIGCDHLVRTEESE